MNGLRDALVKRKKRIVDQALLSSLEFTPVERGSFSAVARWKNGEHRESYTPSNSLRRTGFKLVYSSYQMTFCRFADELVKKIVKVRKISK